MELQDVKTMEDAYKWLRDAWMYEPYNIYLEPYGTKYYICCHRCDGAPNEDDIMIYSLEEFFSRFA